MTTTTPRRLACSVAILAATGIAALAAGAAPALAAGCPNEQARIENNSTQLPECRAYELVTPPFKEGFAPLSPGFTDNGVLTFDASGNFADNGLGGAENQYVATRTATGWQTTSPSPSGPEWWAPNGEGAAGMSSDLRSSLWGMRHPDESTELEYWYLRSPDGTFTRIGPVANPATVLPAGPGTTGPEATVFRPSAVSQDLSHVLFQIPATGLFPGDTSGGNSLYEYVGTGNERPQLVGVDNTGNLISSAGTCALGMSTDGRVVLFEPACGNGRIWARVNETTSIDASASQCTRPPGDPAGACNAPAPATYAGAATDGSRVFFTTTQQLVNGDTDQTSDLYECDIPPGTPVPLGVANSCESLTDVSGPAPGADVEQVVRVSSDGSHVYFLAQGVLAGNLGTNRAAAIAGQHNLYVWEKDAAHPAGRTTFLTSVPSDTIETAQTTADGRYLVFVTPDQLLSSDTDESRDVYRYDDATGVLMRLSTDTSGTGGNAPGFDASISGEAMTADASSVVFRTNEALSPNDTNGQTDVYAWHDGTVSLISSGRPTPENSTEEHFDGISPSGTDIFFSTQARLSPPDGDTNSDLYDARIDGGFSFAAATPCTGEACPGAPAPAPQALHASGTGLLAGAGTPLPSETPPANTKPKPLTKGQKLSRTLKACRAKHNRRKRAACEKQARRTYARSK